MLTNKELDTADFCSLLRKYIGGKIFLNADNREPYLLKQVKKDFLGLAKINHINSPSNYLVVPFTAIVSIQEVEGLGGLILYLTR